MSTPAERVVVPFQAKSHGFVSALEELYENTPAAIHAIDSAGRLVAVSDSWLQLLGYKRDEVIGRRSVEFLTEASRAKALDSSQIYARTGACENIAYEFVHKDGTTVPVLLSAKLIRDQNGAVHGSHAALTDVTALRLAERQLDYSVRYDALTGLLNRYEFEEHIGRGLAGGRTSDREHCVLYIDVDQFKAINDTSGHRVGDTLLQQVATTIRSCLRSDDVLARLGGDEFGVLLNSAGAPIARDVAQRIIDTISTARFDTGKRTHRIEVSIGIANIRGGTPSEALRIADSACFIAKDAGRNRFHLSKAGDAAVEAHTSELELLPVIERALTNNSFELFAQPIMSNIGGAVSYEVLLRWYENGQIRAPFRLLTAAERYGRIRAVDEWVVGATLAALAAHRQRLESIDYISINLSGRTVAEGGFARRIRKAIADYKLPARKLVFELTETAAVANLEAVAGFMTTLREVGCRFALDDFGAGASSFRYLTHLPVDVVKIDGEFVKACHTNTTNQEILRAIHTVATALGKQTVAEFVESSEIQAQIERIGIHSSQGYHFGRPTPLHGILSG